MNREKQNASPQLPTLWGTPFLATTPYPLPPTLCRLHPLGLLRPLTTPLARGPAPTVGAIPSPTHSPQSLQTARALLTHLEAGNGENVLASLPHPHPTHTPRLTCRPDPQGGSCLRCRSAASLLPAGPRQSCFCSLGSGGKAATAWFCGLKIWLCLVLVFCFVLTFLELSRGRSSMEPRAHVSAVHSGAWPAAPRPRGLAGKFRRISCSWGGAG